MASSDLRIVNSLLTIDEKNDVRQSLAKAEAELQRLLDHREKVMNSISQLKKTLVIHRILPREIISDIFSIICAEKIYIPYKQSYSSNLASSPSQVTVSHVCSRWWEIALATPTLWNNVEIMESDCKKWVQVAMELLFNRAGMRSIYFALRMEGISSNKLEKIFHDIILPLHVKKLQLSLPLSALDNLSRKSDDIIANVDEIALDLTFESYEVPFASNSSQVSIAPQFLSKIRSVTVLEWASQHLLEQHLDLQILPWAQMRHLCCNIPLTLSTISDILRQSPLLDVCGIRIHVTKNDETESTLTLPQLRVFRIVLGPQRDQDTQLGRPDFATCEIQ